MVAFIPIILSTPWGKNILVEHINTRINGKIELESLSIGWLGPQTIEKIVLKDTSSTPIATIQKITADASLFSLWWKGATAGAFSVDNLDATITKMAHGHTNIEQTLFKDCCEPFPNATSTGSPLTIILNDVNILLNSTTLKISGKTRQNENQGSIAVDAVVNDTVIKHLLKQNNDLNESIKTLSELGLKAKVDIKNFPLEIVDQFVAMESPHLAGAILDTFGEYLNLQIDQQVTPNGMTISLNGSAPKFSATTKMLIGENFTLLQPLNMVTTLTPALLEKLLAASNNPQLAHLTNPTKLHFTINQLEFPTSLLQSSLKKLDLVPIAINATIDLDSTSVLTQENKTGLTIQHLHGTLESDANTTTGNASINSDLIYNGQLTHLQFTVTAPQLTNWKKLINNDRQKLSFQGNFSGLPIAIVDALAGAEGKLTSTLGQFADLNFNMEQHDKFSLATLQIKADNLSTTEFLFKIGKNIELQKPAEIVFDITPRFVESNLVGAPTPRLQATAKSTLSLASFSIPTPSFDDSAHLQIQKATIKGRFSSAPLTIEALSTIGRTLVKDLVIDFTAIPDSPPHLFLSMGLAQPNNIGPLHDFLGNLATITLATDFHFNADSSLKTNDVEFSLKSDLTQMHLSGVVHEGKYLTLSAPALLTYIPQAATLQNLGLTADSNISIQNTPIKLTISDSYIPLGMNNFSALKMKGVVKINDLFLNNLSEEGEHELAKLDGFTANWNIDGANSLITFNFSGNSHIEKQASGKIFGAISIEDWWHNDLLEFSHTSVRTNINIQKLPTRILSVILKEPELHILVGNTVDFALESYLNLNPQLNGRINLSLHTPNIKGNAALTLDQTVHLHNDYQPNEFHIKVTPKSYNVLRSLIDKDYTSDFILAQDSNITLKLKSLNLPIRKDQLSYWDTGFDADLTIDHLVELNNKTKQSFYLNNIFTHISSQDLSKKVSFKMSAKGLATQESTSAWDITGTLENGLTDHGALNYKGLSLTLDGSIDNLSIPMIGHLVLNPSLTRQLEAIIGSSVNAKIHTQLQAMNGPVFLDLKGENGTLDIDADLNQGIVTLRKDFQAQLLITPQLGKYVLKEFVPIVDGIIGSDQPLKLTISKEGFAFSLNHLSIESVSIHHAALELGKVRFSNDSKLAKVLSLLTPANVDELNVWLTPAYFSLHNGNIKLQRIDLLINNQFPIATWGHVDIPKDHVNMIIGLTGTAISKAFKIKGLTKDQMLQLPLRGTLDDASIDKSKAAGRISALVAQAQGGPQGLVLGTILNIATGGLSEGKIPPSTTNPLPWDNGSSSSNDGTNNQSSNSDGSQTDLKSKNSIKDLKKGATSLLKSVLGK